MHTSLGRYRNVGQPLRWLVFALFLIAILIPALEYKPWTKFDAFVNKATQQMVP